MISVLRLMLILILKYYIFFFETFSPGYYEPEVSAANYRNWWARAQSINIIGRLCASITHKSPCSALPSASDRLKPPEPPQMMIRKLIRALTPDVMSCDVMSELGGSIKTCRSLLLSVSLRVIWGRTLPAWHASSGSRVQKILIKLPRSSK